MAIHLSLIIQTTQLASGNILLEANYNDSLTQFKVSLSAADTLQRTHFSESVNGSLTLIALVLRPRPTTHASVTKAVSRHHHASQKD